jgi:hypothetical protein
MNLEGMRALSTAQVEIAQANLKNLYSQKEVAEENLKALE